MGVEEAEPAEDRDIARAAVRHATGAHHHGRNHEHRNAFLSGIGGPVFASPSISYAGGGGHDNSRPSVSMKVRLRNVRPAPRVTARNNPPNLLFFRVYSPVAWHAEGSAPSDSESVPEARRFKA